MLIWYTNIPEETIYFQERLHDFGYMGLMWTVFFMNFVFPMVLLMSRDSKRNYFFLVFVGCIIFCGSLVRCIYDGNACNCKKSLALRLVRNWNGIRFLGINVIRNP